MSFNEPKAFDSSQIEPVFAVLQTVARDPTASEAVGLLCACLVEIWRRGPDDKDRPTLEEFADYVARGIKGAEYFEFGETVQ